MQISFEANTLSFSLQIVNLKFSETYEWVAKWYGSEVTDS